MAERWTEADVADLSGRTALVTGANAGLGRQITRILCEHGARVLMACRDEGRAAAAADAIRAAGPRGTVETRTLDLASLASIDALVARVRAEEPTLDVLVNNAGVMAVDQSITEDGFETHLGINHLGHFALTEGLFPVLSATPGARVVTHSSMGHRAGRMRFDDLMFERRTYNRWTAYLQSKLANLLFAARARPPARPRRHDALGRRAPRRVEHRARLFGEQLDERGPARVRPVLHPARRDRRTTRGARRHGSHGDRRRVLRAAVRVRRDDTGARDAERAGAQRRGRARAVGGLRATRAPVVPVELTARAHDQHVPRTRYGGAVPTLVLLRHGQSEWNEKNLFTGWHDVGLTARGEAEAAEAGRLLAAEPGLDLRVLHTSVLTRAIRTAELRLAAAERSWLPVRRSWRLNERHYGDLTGKDKRQVAEEFGMDQLLAWRRSYDVPPPPMPLGDERRSDADPRYRDVPPELLPATECLKDVVERVLPYYDGRDRARPARRGPPRRRRGRRRARQLAARAADAPRRDDARPRWSPSRSRRAIPYVYEFDEQLAVRSARYLGDAGGRGRRGRRGPPTGGLTGPTARRPAAGPLRSRRCRARRCAPAPRCPRASTQTLPSPILPVAAASTMASTTASASWSSTRISTRSLGTKSTSYSAPR